jgi:hypothetical protein
MIEADEQPAVFNSIPAAMWWAIETLTTVGYGDMVPSTAAGKLLGGLVSIVGIGMLALFSGVITVGFLDQLKIRREHRAGDHAAQDIKDFKPSADLLDLSQWRASAAAQSTARETLPETCPHCGYRLALDVVEPQKG